MTEGVKMTEDVLLVVSLLTSVAAFLLGLFNLRQLEVPLKRFAGLTAELLRVSEPWIPALRSSRVDNYLQDVLRAFANSDPFFRQALEVSNQTPEHVADVLLVLDPSLETVGKAISLPVDQARALMCSAVRCVDRYDHAVNEIRQELKV